MKKKHIITLASLGAAFALLLALALLGKFVWGWFDENANEEPHIQPDLEAGESYYYFGGVTEMKDIVLLFPQLDTSDILSIRIKNYDGENYSFIHSQGSTYDYFTMTECDENGNFKDEDVYNPPVTGEVSGFSYTSLYDEQTIIPQLIANVGAPSIIERIRPADGGKLTDEFLARYGLSTADKPAFFEIVPYARDPRTGKYLYTPLSTAGGESSKIICHWNDNKYYYVNDDGTNGAEYTGGAENLTIAADKSGVRRVYIGDATVDDSGYYMYLEGRDIVYTTNNAELSSIVDRNLGYYISPRLITESENQYAFRLTPGFTIREGETEWDKISAVGKEIGKTSMVGTTTGRYYHRESNGGESYFEDDIFKSIDLTDPSMQAFASALIGKKVGDAADVLVPKHALTKVGDTVGYLIYHIHGVYVDGAYTENTGETLDGDEKIVVSYSDGSQGPGGNRQQFYGFIDLADKNTPAAIREACIGLTVGKECNIEYVKTYEGIGDEIFYYTYAVDSIQTIFSLKGEAMKKVDYDTVVYFSYRLYEGDTMASVASMTIKIPSAADFDKEETWLAMVTNGSDENREMIAHIMKNIASSLLGRERGSFLNEKNESNLNIAIPFAVEVIDDYELYTDMKVDYSIDYVEELSFAFQNERDIFYGSSLYEIDKTSDKSAYALDTTTTEQVIGLFQDMKGDETVAIGMDHESFVKYGLYAYHLQYVMPFGCKDSTVGDKTYYYSSYDVVYDLYISEVQEDGSRYVGSTQYDIVVKVNDGTVFDFLEWSFAAKWMQNSLLLVSFTNLRRMIFDLNFAEEDGDDFNHIWGFDITVSPREEITDEDGEVTETKAAQLYAALVDAGGRTGPLSYAELNAFMKYSVSEYDASKVSKETVAGKLAQVITSDIGRYTELINEGWKDLDRVYGMNPNETDRPGSSNLRQLLRILNETCYAGELAEDLTEEEINEILAGDYTMRLALTLLDQSDPNNGEVGYTLTFYNYGMNSLVAVRDEQSGNTSSLFYVRSREVRRIAEIVVALTNGVPIDPDRY